VPTGLLSNFARLTTPSVENEELVYQLPTGLFSVVTLEGKKVSWCNWNEFISLDLFPNSWISLKKGVGSNCSWYVSGTPSRNFISSVKLDPTSNRFSSLYEFQLTGLLDNTSASVNLVIDLFWENSPPFIAVPLGFSQQVIIGDKFMLNFTLGINLFDPDAVLGDEIVSISSADLPAWLSQTYVFDQQGRGTFVIFGIIPKIDFACVFHVSASDKLGLTTTIPVNLFQDPDSAAVLFVNSSSFILRGVSAACEKPFFFTFPDDAFILSSFSHTLTLTIRVSKINPLLTPAVRALSLQHILASSYKYPSNTFYDLQELHRRLTGSCNWIHTGNTDDPLAPRPILYGFPSLPDCNTPCAVTYTATTSSGFSAELSVSVFLYSSMSKNKSSATSMYDNSTVTYPVTVTNTVPSLTVILVITAISSALSAFLLASFLHECFYQSYFFK